MSQLRAAEANNELTRKIFEESDSTAEAVVKTVVYNQVSNWMAMALVPVMAGYLLYSGVKAVVESITED